MEMDDDALGEEKTKDSSKGTATDKKMKGTRRNCVQTSYLTNGKIF